MSKVTEIQVCEEKLKEAMLHSDIFALDVLLADDLHFTNHLGQVITKSDDINAHKTKLYTINEITLTEQKIKTYEHLAVVTVKARIKGSFKGLESVNDFRFTRIWDKTLNNIWQVTVGHSSMDHKNL